MAGGLTGGFAAGKPAGFGSNTAFSNMGNLPGAGSLSSLAGNLTGQEGLILDPDEIRGVDFSASDFSLGSVSNTESTVTLKITGKLISHLDESGSTLNLPYGMNSLLSGFAADKMAGLTKGLSTGVQVLGNVF